MPSRARVTKVLVRSVFFSYLLICVWSVPSARGQANDTPQQVDAATVRALIEKVGQLESRLRAQEVEMAELKAASAPKAEAHPVNPEKLTEPQTQPAPPSPEMDHAMGENPADESPRLRIRGFSDVRYTASNLKGTTNSFVLGQFNLFITSRISDQLSTLAEIVTEADSSNNQFGIELERMVLQYKPSDFFQLGIGRYHTSIGFYNTAYHHSTWLQTAVDRPFLFEFEDGGGVLPIHNVGLTANGAIPSGKLGLHYIAEI